jgi:hypothetical protein
MRVEYRAQAPQPVAGDGGNLHLGASGSGESRHRAFRAVMERDATPPRIGQGVWGAPRDTGIVWPRPGCGRCEYRERNDARDCQINEAAN